MAVLRELMNSRTAYVFCILVAVATTLVALRGCQLEDSVLDLTDSNVTQVLRGPAPSTATQTAAPTIAPTAAQTGAYLIIVPATEPTLAPTAPTPAPTAPTSAPTAPTPAPTGPTAAPTAPTPAPTAPTPAPTPAPTAPTPAPTAPTAVPTAPTPVPTAPTPAPTAPTPAPTAPTAAPTAPTEQPTATPTSAPLLAQNQIRVFWGNCLFEDDSRRTDCCSPGLAWATGNHVVEQCRRMQVEGFEGGNRIHFDSKNREVVLLNMNKIFRLAVDQGGTVPSGTTITEVQPPTGWTFQFASSMAYNSATGDFFIKDQYCKVEYLQEAEQQKLLNIKNSNGEPFTWAPSSIKPSWMKLDMAADNFSLAFGTCGYPGTCLAHNSPDASCATSASGKNGDKSCREKWDYFDRLDEVNDGRWIDPTGDVAAFSYSNLGVFDVDEETGDMYVGDWEQGCHSANPIPGDHWGQRSVVWMINASTGQAKIVAGHMNHVRTHGMTNVILDAPAVQSSLGIIAGVRVHPVTKEPHFMIYPNHFLKVDAEGILRQVPCGPCGSGEISSFVFHKASNQWIISGGKEIAYENGTSIIKAYGQVQSSSSGLQFGGGYGINYFKNDWRSTANHGPFNTNDFGITTGWQSDLAIDNVNNELYVKDEFAGLIWVIGL